MDKKLTEFYEILMSRVSVRKYQDKQIEADKLYRLFEILRRSQSAANCQPWHFIVLKKGFQRERFDNTVILKESFKEAPIIIVACAEPEKAWSRCYDGKNYGIVDVTIAVTEMICAATAEGLGTCWIAAFDPQQVVEMLGIPEGVEPIGLIALGYPYAPAALKKVKKNRKELEEIIHQGRWKGH